MILLLLFMDILRILIKIRELLNNIKLHQYKIIHIIILFNFLLLLVSSFKIFNNYLLHLFLLLNHSFIHNSLYMVSLLLFQITIFHLWYFLQSKKNKVNYHKQSIYNLIAVMSYQIKIILKIIVILKILLVLLWKVLLSFNQIN